MAKKKLTFEELKKLRSNSKIIIVDKCKNKSFPGKLIQGIFGPIIQCKNSQIKLNQEILNYSFFQKRRIIKVKDKDKFRLKLSDFFK